MRLNGVMESGLYVYVMESASECVCDGGMCVICSLCSNVCDGVCV